MTQLRRSKQDNWQDKMAVKGVANFKHNVVIKGLYTATCRYAIWTCVVKSTYIFIVAFIQVI